LDEVRVRYLGKKGLLTAELKALGKLPAADRPAAGQVINQAKQTIAAAVEARHEALEVARQSAAVLAKQVEWFTDHVPDLKHADCIRQIQEPLIIEMAELDVMRKQEAQTMKAFITRTHDDLTDKYQRFPVKLPRRCIFAGGTNESAYLKDHTGNRRYWSVHCTHADIEGLRAVVDQLWAEAVARYRAGEPWWLSDELEEIARPQQDARREVDPWQDEVSAYVRLRLTKGMRTAFMEEICTRLGIDLDKRDQRTSVRVRTCFEALGWRKGSPRNDEGVNENGFYLPADKPKRT